MVKFLFKYYFEDFLNIKVFFSFIVYRYRINLEGERNLGVNFGNVYYENCIIDVVY